MTKVSVIMPSYNHDKYIAEAVESVLAQSFTDFEFIIIDDASSDYSVKFLERIKDPRVKVIFHTENQGVCRTVNEAFALTQGEYIALIASDDVWHPGKLEIQVNFLDEHPETLAVFSVVHTIDSKGVKLKGDKQRHFPANIDRVTVLKIALQGFNVLNAPSEMLRRSAMADEPHFYDPRFLQFQDLEQHIRIACKGEIHVLPIPLVYYRWHGENLSNGGEISSIRSNFEQGFILDSLLRIKDLDLVQQIVPGLPPEMLKEEMIPYIFASKAVDVRNFVIRLWGYRKLAEYLIDEDLAKTAWECARLTPNMLYKQIKPLPAER